MQIFLRKRESACMNERFLKKIYLADTLHLQNAQHFGGDSEQKKPLPNKLESGSSFAESYANLAVFSFTPGPMVGAMVTLFRY